MKIKTSESDTFNDEMLNSKWFPLISFKRTYFLSCGDLIQQPTSEIIFIWADEWETIPNYESLTAMLLTITECYEQGAYYFDNCGTLRYKTLLEQEIHKKYNSSSRYDEMRGG